MYNNDGILALRAALQESIHAHHPRTRMAMLSRCPMPAWKYP